MVSRERDVHYRSGLREVYFGVKLRGMVHVGRFVEVFAATERPDEGQTISVDANKASLKRQAESGRARLQNLWLSFYDEGASLHDLMHEYAGAEEDTEGGGGSGASDPMTACARTSGGGGGGAAAADDGGGLGGGGGGGELVAAEAGGRGGAGGGKSGSTGSGSGSGGGGGASGGDGGAGGGGGMGGGGLQMLVPSALWHRMRRLEEGQLVLREIVRQLLVAVAELHERGVVHRDLKPSNLIVRLEHQQHSTDSDGLSALPGLTLRLIDFGSSFDAESLADPELYPPGEDPAASETAAYAPPEVALQEGASMGARTQAYDLWSCGVVLLELLLGSADVFNADARTHAIIALALGDASAAVQRRAALAHAWERLGILTPASRRGATAAEREAARASFVAAVRKRDPLPAFAIPERALDLAWNLLQWEPLRRIRARDALGHPFFSAPASGSQMGLVAR
ncbi:kinase-like domain-containing protein [Pavlovales sp. CCMP2436]|nr:kinase-like domain-containing protein [Pavlovales sp. CCMP2436]